MSQNLDYLIRINSRLDGIESALSALDKMEKQIKTTSGLGKGFGAAFQFNNIVQAAQNVAGAFSSALAPAVSFETSMAELAAVTGQGGKTLELIEANARKLSTTFGVSAADAASTYTKVLSDLGPDIAKSPEALDNMGIAILTLSKTMGGDAVGAATALTGAMNSYGVDLSDPVRASSEMARMMNVLAKSAQDGSAMVPQLAETLKTAGSVAFKSGLSFEQFSAASQVLATANLKGAEAGTGLRNVLLKMSEGRFLPKDTQEALTAAGVNINKLGNTTIPLSDRLRELQKVQGDSALVAKLFGSENIIAANALLSNTDKLDTFTKSATGSNSATEQAAIQMNTFAERMKRLQANVQDVGISIFQSLQPAIAFISDTLFAVFQNLEPVQTAFSALIAAVQPPLEKLGTVLGLTGVSTKSLADGFVNGLASAIRFLTPILATAITFIANIYTTIEPFLPLVLSVVAAVQAWSIVQGVLNLVLSLNPIVAVVGAIVLFIAAIKTAYDNSQTFRSVLSGIGAVAQSLGSVFTALGQTIIGALTFNPQMFAEGAKNLTSQIQNIADKGGIGGIYEAGAGKLIADERQQAIIKEGNKLAGSQIGQGVASGAAKDIFPPTPTKPGAGGSSPAATAATDSVTKGGSKPTNIYINIATMKAAEKIETRIDGGSSVSDLEATLQEMLLRVTNAANQTYGA
jgi:TP901 family phage tail tape measure protein